MFWFTVEQTALNKVCLVAVCVPLSRDFLMRWCVHFRIGYVPWSFIECQVSLSIGFRRRIRILSRDRSELTPWTDLADAVELLASLSWFSQVPPKDSPVFKLCLEALGNLSNESRGRVVHGESFTFDGLCVNQADRCLTRHLADVLQGCLKLTIQVAQMLVSSFIPVDVDRAEGRGLHVDTMVLRCRRIALVVMIGSFLRLQWLCALPARLLLQWL